MAKKNAAASAMAHQRWKKTPKKARVEFMKRVRAGGKMTPEKAEPVKA